MFSQGYFQTLALSYVRTELLFFVGRGMSGLTQMPPGVGVLGAEDGAHLEHAPQVRRDGHLLVQLWRLGQAGRTPEVVGPEHAGTALTLPCHRKILTRAKETQKYLSSGKPAECEDWKFPLVWDPLDVQTCIMYQAGVCLVPPISLGVWISMKPWAYRLSRKSWHTPDWMRIIQLLAGTRRSSHLHSHIVAQSFESVHS